MVPDKEKRYASHNMLVIVSNMAVEGNNIKIGSHGLMLITLCFFADWCLKMIPSGDVDANFCCHVCYQLALMMR